MADGQTRSIHWLSPKVEEDLVTLFHKFDLKSLGEQDESYLGYNVDEILSFAEASFLTSKALIKRLVSQYGHLIENTKFSASFLHKLQWIINRCI